MTTYSITINERTAFGKELIRNLSAMPEIIFVKNDGSTKQTEKAAILAEMRKSREEAEQIMKSGKKGHTIAEILETI